MDKLRLAPRLGLAFGPVLAMAGSGIVPRRRNAVVARRRSLAPDQAASRPA